MNNREQVPQPENSLDEIDMDSIGSVDDFLRELEEKEKALHITADLKIEVSDPDIRSSALQDLVEEEVASAKPSAAAPSPASKLPAGQKTRLYELEKEIERLNERVRNLRTERNETQEKSDRRLKDFENYKYRMDRERRGAFIDQITNLASQMLPALDNLERALDAADQLKGEKSPDFQQFFDGIVLVNQQVNEIFGSMGVEAIASVGEPFDPNFHEAVATEERDDMEPNTVTDEMLRGYRIGNRVIRHSLVRVTAAPANYRFSNPPGESEPATSPDQDQAVETPPDASTEE